MDDPFWQDLESRFKQLLDELGEPVRADWISGMWNAAGDRWRFSSLQSRMFDKSERDVILDRFMNLAERAAIHLGCSSRERIGRVHFWLDFLKSASPRFRDAGPDRTGDEHYTTGTIEALFQASAEGCYKLQTGELLLKADPTDRALATVETDSDHDKATITGRREQVDAFLKACNKCSKSRIYRRHLWLAVEHTKGRQFEYWQASSDHATRADNQNFNRILGMQPEDFIALLHRRKLVPDDNR